MRCHPICRYRVRDRYVYIEREIPALHKQHTNTFRLEGIYIFSKFCFTDLLSFFKCVTTLKSKKKKNYEMKITRKMK